MRGLFGLVTGKGMLMYGLPVLLVALLASHAWVWRTAVTRERDRQDAQRLVQVEQAARTMHAIAAEEIAQAQRRRVVYRTINREVAAHAATTPAVPCLDAVGLRLVGAAAAGRDSAQPDRGLP